eukprot:scaffold90763_cov20-Tisochrysis_lutea.AAC.3
MHTSSWTLGRYVFALLQMQVISHLYEMHGEEVASMLDEGPKKGERPCSIICLLFRLPPLPVEFQKVSALDVHANLQAPLVDRPSKKCFPK